MANWKYLTEEKKVDHELYGKKTALGWFFLFLKVSIVLSFLKVAGDFMDYERLYNQVNGTLISDLPEGEFFLIRSMSIIYTLVFIYLMGIFGKSKKTVVSLIVLLTTLPIVSFISSLILSQRFELYNADIIIGSFLQAFLSLIFISIFVVYGLFSKTFNLQYLGRVKKI